MERSIWEFQTFYSNFDLIIVGAGFGGLWTAYHTKIKNPKWEILILERGSLPAGASTKNAGFACFGSPTEIISDIEKMGENFAIDLVEKRISGISIIRSVLGDSSINYEDCGGYEIFSNTPEGLEENVEKLNKILFKITEREKTYEWCNEKIEKLGLKEFSSMIFNNIEGGIHSANALIKLESIVKSMGIKIIYGEDVINYDKKSDIVIITSRSIFKTKRAIFCINAFSKNIFSDVEIKPTRGQLITTGPIQDLKLFGTFHYDEGYYYFRNLGNRIILGGARNIDFDSEETSDFGMNQKIQNHLEEFLKKHFDVKNIPRIEYRWSGIMGFTPNKIPIFKEINEGIYILCACNGMGVALLPKFTSELQID
jgi:glycine/D-amino acid oxidase-like deaminating enzyme